MSDNNNVDPFVVDFSTPKRKPIDYFPKIKLWTNRDTTQYEASPKQTSEGKRGRPRSDVINTLIQQGTISPSSIKCPICYRVFPREKSLTAHMRVHSGSRPFKCDYPKCGKRFAQSGQMNTHRRLHSGEKPFCCMAEGCNVRFTHSNRHCSDHPDSTLRRKRDLNFVPIISPNETNAEVLIWQQNFVAARTENTTPKPRRSKVKTNNPSTPMSPPVANILETPPNRNKSKRGLGPLMDREQRLNRVTPVTSSPYERPVYHYSPNLSSPPAQYSYLIAEEDMSHRLVPLVDARLHRSPQVVSDHRPSEYTAEHRNPENPFEIDGVRPLDADDYFGYKNESPRGVYKITEEHSLAFYPDSPIPYQLCVGDVTPLKKISHSTHSLNANEVNIETTIAPGEFLSADVLAVPQVDLYKPPQMSQKSGKYCSSENMSAKYKAPKKHWLYQSNVDADSTRQASKNMCYKITADRSSVKDTILGAMALVQLGKANDDSMQPLNLCTNKSLRK